MNSENSHGPAHHCAVGICHLTCKLAKLASVIDMRIEIVC